MNTITILIIFILILVIVAAAVMPSLGTKYRLGNEIDLWFTGNLLSRGHMLLDSKVEGFVEHLHKNPPNYRQLQVGFSGPSQFITYSYASLKEHVVPFRRELRKAMTDYFGDLEKFRTPGQCVIHYRTGDFMNNSHYGVKIVTPKHIVDQVVDLKPDSVLLLDGGSKFQGGEKTFASINHYGVDCVKNEIRERLRDHGITFKESNGSADEDFVTMACADYLVTGLGSYAITASVANTIGTIRTPAFELLNPNDMEEGKNYSRKPEKMSKKWKTFYSG
jgi:hypothetical protein